MANASKEVSVVMVGIGGYAGSYVRRLLDEGEQHDVRLVGAVDPTAKGELKPEVQSLVDELKARDVLIYDDLASFYAEHAADLTMIASPHHYHASQTQQALAAGSCVLCEKPLAATIQDAREMAQAEKQSGRFVAIGYQWSFSPAIQELKADIMTGRLGKPIRLRTIVFWPRPRSYYCRNNWAGAIKSADGQWVLDSPANNATAHFLHNMFYVLGDSVPASDAPASVQAEVYRANDIANYDTAAIRCTTVGGAEVLYYTTHAVTAYRGPVFCYEFENATVTFGDPDENVIARFTDGSEKQYGDPGVDNFIKLWQAADCVRIGERPVCTIEAATAQTLCVNGVQESAGQARPFPAELVELTDDDDDPITFCHGLAEEFLACYDEGVLPSDRGCATWAKAGSVVDLTAYDFFPASEK